MYNQKTWDLNGDIHEIEITWAGKYGARGEKRAEKKKPTPEQIADQNRKNKRKTVRRLLAANFYEDDLFCTLKYPQGTRKSLKEVQKDIESFFRKMRRYYKKLNEEMQYIYRLEIGSKGGIHIHLILNRIEGQETAEKVQTAWQQGRVNFQSLYTTENGFDTLAEYITKEAEEGTKEYKQLSLLPEVEQKAYTKYSCSRNLKRPEPEKKEYRRWTVRKILQSIENAGVGSIKPTVGFYIVPESARFGINPFTGMSFLHYTERKIEPTHQKRPKRESEKPRNRRKSSH